MTRVKICGIQRIEHALVAAEAGADMIGLVFAPSRRRIEPEAAAELVAQLRESSTAILVGVFVHEAPAEINRIAALCGLDYAQLSGDEMADTVHALDLPAIQVFHVAQDGIDTKLADRVDRSQADLVLLDTAQQDSYGGTGRSFLWTGGALIERPFLLAGGLDPENAAEAVRALDPWGVDVSSGVETDGAKDPAKIRRFVARVKSGAPAP